MVYLSRIYTKSGDQGETALGDGQRVRKDHPRIAAVGDVDELNSALGVLLAEPSVSPTELHPLLLGIQNDLFDLGGDLCIPRSESEAVGAALRILPEQVTRLEQAIDEYNASLQPLHSFILPGGTRTAAWLHFTRAICRRAERSLVTLASLESINPQVVIYLNRLSDLLFVLARISNNHGKNDVLWAPGKNQKT